MASNIIALNNNIINNAEYSIEFFDFRDYTLSADDFSMSDWASFIANTETFILPLKGVSSYTKNQKIWYRNSSPLFDKITVDLDPSKENNLLEFIARKGKYNNIVLDDLKMLGAIIKFKYISNSHKQAYKNLFVGRISVAKNTADSLQLTIDQLNKILANSDFEKHVKQSPTGSCYNFISIKQAFENIYNAPHNIIDTKSYPITPFRLDESSYLPIESEDIVERDDNILTNDQIYAEDFVGNTNRNIHTQFFYNENDPSCAYKMIEYDDDKNIITDSDFAGTFEVLNWTVWNNTASALANWPLNDGYEKQVITNYSRFFRPFKIVLASDKEATALLDGNYRVKRDYVYPNYDDDVFGVIDNSLYEPVVNNYIFGQRKILSGDTGSICEPGDILVYFEQLGDVRFRIDGTNIPSANVLYDNYSTIWVYNQSKDIVYFDHITTFVQSTPLPSMWLDINNFIQTERIVFASGLNYDSSNNNNAFFASYTKPMCAVYNNTTGVYSPRQFVADEHSYKSSQDVNGEGGGFTGGKLHLPYILGDYDLSLTAGYNNAKETLDYIQKYNKPKSVRVSADGEEIYFLKGVASGFTLWSETTTPSYTPTKVKRVDYDKVTEFPTVLNWLKKDLYITKTDGTVAVSQKEHTSNYFLNYDFMVNENTPLFTELCNGFDSNSMALIDTCRLNTAGEVTGLSRVVKTTTDSLIESSHTTVSTNKSKIVANFRTNYNLNYWINDNVVYQQFSEYFTYSAGTIILDFYIDDTKERAIIQSNTELTYYNTETSEIIHTKNEVGFEYILACDRDYFIFVNPLEDKSNEIIRVAQVTNDPVRLLSFSGNRYVAGDRLASSFFKNSYYDGNGVLNIGFIGSKLTIDDNDITTISLKRYKYDLFEYTPKAIEKNGFSQQDNSSASNQEEDDLEYDQTISIEMTSNKDVQLNFTITRTGEDTLFWEATNEFFTEEDTIIEDGFNIIEIDLTGDFLGIHITCNFFNTSLAQGEKFRGVIERREYADAIAPETIIASTNPFPFLDDSNLSLDLPFVYEEDKTTFTEVVTGYFLDGDAIREVVELEIKVPCLLLFDENYNTFNPNTIITISSDTKYNKGYELISTTEVEPYATNKCDYYIEKMVLNKNDGTTTLNLVSV